MSPRTPHPQAKQLLHQGCHSQSSLHRRPGDKGNRWVRWDPQAYPTHQRGGHCQRSLRASHTQGFCVPRGRESVICRKGSYSLRCSEPAEEVLVGLVICGFSSVSSRYQNGKESCWHRRQQSGKGHCGWGEVAGKSLSLGKMLPDTLTCAQVLTSSGRPWGLLRRSFSLWNEHAQLSSPFESGLLGKRGGSQKAGRQKDGLSPPPPAPPPTRWPSLGAEELAGFSLRVLTPPLTAPPPSSLFLPLLEELS